MSASRRLTRAPFIGPVLAAVLVTVLAVNVMATPVAAAGPIRTTACTSLTDAELNSVAGGLNWVGIIDGSCALTGVGSLFMKAVPVAAAFCAGWGVGRFIDAYFIG